MKDAECAETNEKSMNFQYKIDHNSKKNKNLKSDFSFDSALWASFMKFASLLRGVCISFLGAASYGDTKASDGPCPKIINLVRKLEYISRKSCRCCMIENTSSACQRIEFL